MYEPVSVALDIHGMYTGPIGHINMYMVFLLCICIIHELNCMVGPILIHAYLGE